MTREERAREQAEMRAGPAYELQYDCQVLTIGEAVSFALAFADAEAAAMRERAAGCATDAAEAARPYANGVGLGPATERHRMLEAERIAAAIRALPATGEVGRG